MSDVIAPPSVRALARQKGIDIEKLAREIGRTSIAREDVEGFPCLRHAPPDLLSRCVRLRATRAIPGAPRSPSEA